MMEILSRKDRNQRLRPLRKLNCVDQESRKTAAIKKKPQETT